MISAMVQKMMTNPAGTHKKVNIALSFFAKIATTPMTNPANPRAAMKKVGNGRKAIIFIAIKIIMARVNPSAHFPVDVLGNNFMFLHSYQARLSAIMSLPSLAINSLE
jgi:hypothetical protein